MPIGTTNLHCAGSADNQALSATTGQSTTVCVTLGRGVAVGSAHVAQSFRRQARVLRDLQLGTRVTVHV
jgi:hypothetical protein